MIMAGEHASSPHVSQRFPTFVSYFSMVKRSELDIYSQFKVSLFLRIMPWNISTNKHSGRK
jgi:hypothetical protein